MGVTEESHLWISCWIDRGYICAILLTLKSVRTVILQMNVFLILKWSLITRWGRYSHYGLSGVVGLPVVKRG